jgi:predicted peptidase
VGDGSISYLLYLPKDYATGGNSSSKWPLMLFLHGRGESDGPLSVVKKWGPPYFIEHGVSFHYIIASPQCPPSPQSWDKPVEQALLVALLDHLTNQFQADTDRIYLTGLSMGGYGSWRLAADHPERFAAVVPICGGGNPSDAAKLKDLPIWAWHGLSDPAVPVKNSIDMVEAIKKAGGSKVRLTTPRRRPPQFLASRLRDPGPLRMAGQTIPDEPRAGQISPRRKFTQCRGVFALLPTARFSSR